MLTTRTRFTPLFLATIACCSWWAASAQAADPPLAQYRSTDQLTWKPMTSSPDTSLSQPDLLHIPKPTPARTGPDAGAILLYTVRADGLSRCVSTDQGRAWSAPEAILLNGLPAELAAHRPIAPSAVQLDDGRIRIYFALAAPTGPREQPRRVPTPEAPTIPNLPKRPVPDRQPSLPDPDLQADPIRPHAGASPATSFHSAVSNDGLNFAVEDGVRFALADARDPEVVRLPDPKSDDPDTRRIGPWLMFFTRADAVLLATSRDGLTWTRDEAFAWSGRTAPSCLVPAAGASAARAIRVYAKVASATASGVFDPSTGTITADSGDRISGAGGDPAVCPTGDGAFLLMRAQSAADKPVRREPPSRTPDSPDPVPPRPPPSPPSLPGRPDPR